MNTYRQPFRGEYPISQRFGERVTDPKGHTGIDYACPVGTPILASADGTVIYAGWKDGGYGYCVFLRHGDGNLTIYEHLTAPVPVSVGQKIQQGQVIGYSGNTGNSTGPHLHFEARASNGQPFDPMRLPLMSVDDTIQIPSGLTQHPAIPEGKCRIVCPAAYQRNWNTLQRKPMEDMLHEGDVVYAFADVKYQDWLPFRYIGGNSCVAEYDSDGTQILEAINDSNEKED